VVGSWASCKLQGTGDLKEGKRLVGPGWAWVVAKPGLVWPAGWWAVSGWMGWDGMDWMDGRMAAGWFGGGDVERGLWFVGLE
jgi:hypothetical protein